MPKRVQEQALAFSFPDAWTVWKYDATGYYTKNLRGFAGGTKGVDIVAFDASSGDLWLIEAKDYRNVRRTKAVDLFREVAMKVRDTLAGLMVLRVRAGGTDKNDAQSVTAGTTRIRVVLHLEQRRHTFKAMPQAVDPKTAHDVLKREVGAVDNQPRVVDVRMQRQPGTWSVTSNSG